MRNYFLLRKFEIGNTRDFLDTLDAASGYKARSMATDSPASIPRAASKPD